MSAGPSTPQRNERLDGYRGIWFRLGQFDGEYGDKYSGGLGTYTMKHVPMAIYDQPAKRTFFTYGGTRPHNRDLVIMVGAYDHEALAVSRPVVVDPKPEPNPSYDSDTVVDPHDNASIALDGEGHVIVWVAGRGRQRPGRIYRGDTPHRIDNFSKTAERELFAYPQPWWIGDRFVVLFTIYDEAGNRELYWEITADGTPGNRWKLAGIGGQYQISTVADDVLITAFNWHPDGDVDQRTNLYVLQCRDGKTWETVDGHAIATPVERPDHRSRVWNYQAANRLVYLNDIGSDEAGHPVILYVTSGGPEPGPGNDPRRLKVARWTGTDWERSVVTTTDHNYDSGSLYLDAEEWTVLAPTAPGAQAYGTGGEIECWRSKDRGTTWRKAAQITTASTYNHTYVRRPHGYAHPFAAMWADGNPFAESPSRLYIGNSAGDAWQLPDHMDQAWAELG